MRRIKMIILLFFIPISLCAQDELENLLAMGLRDANTFMNAYMEPAAESLIFNSANGWIQEAQVKKPLHFDLSIITNATLIKKDLTHFTLNTNDYDLLRFSDGSVSKEVANILGENEEEILVYTELVNDEGEIETVQFYLPQGLTSTAINFVPMAYLQARFGLVKATEIKARFFPKIEVEGVSFDALGIGLQHEISQWLPEKFPIALSGFIAYNHMGAGYKFEDDQIVEGVDSRFKLNQNYMLYQLQASTKLKILNFYGGLGYIGGSSFFDVKGTYEVTDGTPVTENNNIYVDPISIKHKVGGMRANVGVKLRLAFFKLHLDYNMAKYNTISAGLHFGTKN